MAILPANLRWTCRSFAHFLPTSSSSRVTRNWKEQTRFCKGPWELADVRTQLPKIPWRFILCKYLNPRRRRWCFSPAQKLAYVGKKEHLLRRPGLAKKCLTFGLTLSRQRLRRAEKGTLWCPFILCVQSNLTDSQRSFLRQFQATANANCAITGRTGFPSGL